MLILYDSESCYRRIPYSLLISSIRVIKYWRIHFHQKKIIPPTSVAPPTVNETYINMGDEHPHSFSPFVAVCFTVNYIMGTGFLTLPWAFNSAGIGLSAICLAFFCWASNVSKNYILETMGRAEMLYGDKKDEGDDEEDEEESLVMGKSMGVDGNGGYGSTDVLPQDVGPLKR